jgi:hypothetical protein
MSRLGVAVVSVLIFCNLSALTPVWATNPYINIPEMQRLSREAWERWWSSLDQRQQQIVKAVSLEEEAYRRATGNRYIPINQENLIVLLRRIGAQDQDRALVLQRMQVHAAAQDAMARVDRMLEYFHSNPTWYLPHNQP